MSAIARPVRAITLALAVAASLIAAPAAFAAPAAGVQTDIYCPDVPTALTVTSTTATSVFLSWRSSADNVGVTGYQVFKGTTLVGTPSTAAFTVAGLAPNSTHTFTVLAADAAGNKSPLSAQVTARTTPVSPGVNLAQGKRVITSNNAPGSLPESVTDGDVYSWWDGPYRSFPETVKVDLGKGTKVGRLVLKLPPVAAWVYRNQTITVLGGMTGSTPIVVAKGTYLFDAATGNTVTITFPVQSLQFPTLLIEDNTCSETAQVGELEAYAS